MCMRYRARPPLLKPRAWAAAARRSRLRWPRRERPPRPVAASMRARRYGRCGGSPPPAPPSSLVRRRPRQAGPNKTLAQTCRRRRRRRGGKSTSWQRRRHPAHPSTTHTSTPYENTLSRAPHTSHTNGRHAARPQRTWCPPPPRAGGGRARPEGAAPANPRAPPNPSSRTPRPPWPCPAVSAAFLSAATETCCRVHVRRPTTRTPHRTRRPSNPRATGPAAPRPPVGEQGGAGVTRPTPTLTDGSPSSTPLPSTTIARHSSARATGHDAASSTHSDGHGRRLCAQRSRPHGSRRRPRRL